jgi:hypothetical protein
MTEAGDERPTAPNLHAGDAALRRQQIARVIHRREVRDLSAFIGGLQGTLMIEEVVAIASHDDVPIRFHKATTSGAVNRSIKETLKLIQFLSIKILDEFESYFNDARCNAVAICHDDALFYCNSTNRSACSPRKKIV